MEDKDDAGRKLAVGLRSDARGLSQRAISLVTQLTALIDDEGADLSTFTSDSRSCTLIEHCMFDASIAIMRMTDEVRRLRESR